MDTVLKPIMKISDYWITYEWQKRGSLHCHCFLWLEDQPDMLQLMKNYNSGDVSKKNSAIEDILKALEF